MVICFALLDTPSMAIKTEPPLSSRDMVGDEYNAGEQQRYRDSMQKKLEDLEKRILNLESLQ